MLNCGIVSSVKLDAKFSDFTLTFHSSFVLSAHRLGIGKYIHTYTYKDTHTYIHIHTHTYTYIHVHTYTYIHKYTYRIQDMGMM